MDRVVYSQVSFDDAVFRQEFGIGISVQLAGRPFPKLFQTKSCSHSEGLAEHIAKVFAAVRCRPLKLKTDVLSTVVTHNRVDARIHCRLTSGRHTQLTKTNIKRPD